MRLHHRVLVTVALLMPLWLAACGSGGSTEDEEGAQAGDVYGITQANRLVSFNRATPQVFSSSIDLIGLLSPGEEVIIGMDFRPANGELYVLTVNFGDMTPGQGRLYTVDLGSGRLTARQILTASAPGMNGCGAGPAYAGLPLAAGAGVDFNPVVDRLRVVASNGLNLRINVDNGITCRDGDINGGSPVLASAYTNNFVTAAGTTLFGIDVGADRLVIQDPPNGGTIVGVGAGLGVGVGVNVVDANLDIEGEDNRALAALSVNGTAALYDIPLDTGVARLLGTIGTGENLRAMAIRPVSTAAPNVVVVTTNNRLIGFNAQTPGLPIASGAIIGLQAGENVVGIDFRPANGQLYALGSTSRLYTLNLLTAAATEVGLGPFNPLLTGAAFGFDFNPVPDRIRVVGDDRQNLRLHPDTGAVAGVDIQLSEQSMVVGSAYTNNFAGTAVTTLFGIDANTDMLVRQGGVDGNPTPNDGQITPIGPLGPPGFDTTPNVGFDIAGPLNGSVLAALEVAGVSGLYRINLANGTATLIGPIGGLGAGETVRGLAILP